MTVPEAPGLAFKKAMKKRENKGLQVETGKVASK